MEPWDTPELRTRINDILRRDPRAGRGTFQAELGLSHWQAKTVLARLRGGESPPEVRTQELSTGKDWETAVVIGDLHRPYHDPKAVALVEAFLSRLRPDVVYLAGDICDFYAVSRFEKDPRRMAEENLGDEIEDTRAWLSGLRRRLPRARIVFITGNHEHRLAKYLHSRAPELSWLKALSVPALLGLEKSRIEFIPCTGDKFTDTFVRWGDLLIGHFDTARGDSAATARALLTKLGLSLIQGHCHSVGSYNRVLESVGLIVAWENGCLCSLTPVYCRPSNWAHSFSVVHKERGGNLFQVERVLLVDHRFRYGGELWSA